MNIINRFSIKSLAAFILSLGLFSVISIGTAPLVLANSTHHWIGAACNVNTAPVNCNWSSSSNWLEEEAPLSGDSIVLDANFMGYGTAINAGNPVNDISYLSVNTITLSGKYVSPSDTAIINLLENLTITGGITQNSVETFFMNGNIILGDDSLITISNNGGSLYIGDESGSDGFNLGGYTLTINNTTSSILSMRSIIGSNNPASKLVFNGGDDSYLWLEAENSYTGETYINSGNVSQFDKQNNMFGRSNVYIASSGVVWFDYSTDITIDNIIEIEGALSGSPKTSIYFLNELNNKNTITIPNIVLNGSTRLSNNYEQIIDLNGIKDNGFCVQYFGLAKNNELDGVSNGFINGPDYCGLNAENNDDDNSGDNGKKLLPPNTAIIQYNLANPYIVASFGIISAFMTIFVFRKINK